MPMHTPCAHEVVHSSRTCQLPSTVQTSTLAPAASQRCAPASHGKLLGAGATPESDAPPSAAGGAAMPAAPTSTLRAPAPPPPPAAPASLPAASTAPSELVSTGIWFMQLPPEAVVPEGQSTGVQPIQLTKLVIQMVARRLERSKDMRRVVPLSRTLTRCRCTSAM